MAVGWQDVRRLALALPGSSELTSGAGLAQWRAGRAMFAWERPLLRTERAALGQAAPDGPVLGARVPDLGAKQALLADPGLPALFDTPHLRGYPAVLVELDRVELADLEELVVEAWRCRAGVRLLRAYDAERE